MALKTFISTSLISRSAWQEKEGKLGLARHISYCKQWELETWESGIEANGEQALDALY